MKKILKGISYLFIAVFIIISSNTVFQVHAMTEEEAAWVEEARGALQEILKERDVMALVYLTDTYEVRSEASLDSGVVAEVASGQMVLIQDIMIDEEYQVWEKVSFYYEGMEKTGYIPRTYLACSDEVFLEWEAAYGMNPASRNTYSMEAVSVYADIEGFPASYQPALKALKDKHPNWQFVPMNTGLDWNTSIAQEMLGGKSLVPNSFPDYMKEGVYGAGWSYASKGTLELYMDPRNSLTEDAIFQFELLTYNATYHTESAVQNFLNNTFMRGKAPGTDQTYANIFWTNGSSLNVSPFHLASRVYQEQGQGTSPLISGTYPGYEGYYNYFNIKASGKTEEEIYKNGLAHAKSQGWNSANASIYGGARFISKDYILKGQNTLYLQKFNVNKNSPYGPYNHQYMQNICAPTSEAKGIKNSYKKANSLENTFVFSIPVFLNMPEAPCPMPSASNDVVLTPPAGYTDATVYLDGVAYKAEARNGKYVVTAKDSTAKTAIMYQYNGSGVPVGMYVWSLSYGKGAYTATAVPELQDLLTYHGFSIRIVGKAGIRFKTGIATELRNKLATEGVAGYKLKEYGTLVMNNANTAQYPMIKGGEKVLSGMSYGYNASGVLEDKIYETTGGRYRFTSVLVGQPVEQYKTEYAFRGYIVLNKDGQDVVLYGPPMAKSIYALAQQVLASGIYQPGSSAEAFLKKLIADADSI